MITFSGLPELEIMAPPRPAADDLICLVLILKSSLVIPVILVAPMSSHRTTQQWRLTVKIGLRMQTDCYSRTPSIYLQVV